MSIIQYKTISDPDIKLYPELTTSAPESTQLQNRNMVWKFMTETPEIQIHKNTVEHLYMLCLDKKHHLLGIFLLAKGTVDEFIVSPRDVIINAALMGSYNIILIHNHPSGDVKPSDDDVTLTKGIEQALDLCGMSLLDHIIIGKDQYKPVF